VIGTLATILEFFKTSNLQTFKPSNLGFVSKLPTFNARHAAFFQNFKTFNL
jgi:hypothetical protein